MRLRLVGRFQGLSVDITDAFNKRIRSLLGSLGEVTVRLRFVHRDQEILTRLFTGTNGSQSPGCNAREMVRTRRRLRSLLCPSFEVPPSAATGGSLVCTHIQVNENL